MLPGFKSFKLYRGDSFSFRLTLSSSSLPYNLTGSTFKSQIKEKGKTAIAAELTPVVENAVSGIVTFVLTTTESDKLIPGKKYFYDIEMTKNQSKSTILAGPIVVVADISS